MKYVDLPPRIFVDRHEEGPELGPIDVCMLTLDAVIFLERCLNTVYREIPVRRLLVCDGGSKDGTIEVLEKYPRVQLFVRPDIRTTGKAVEFLFSQVETESFVIIDADIELPLGWYDDMCKYQDKYDFLECSGRILAFHIYRKYPLAINELERSHEFCFLGRKEAVKEFKCEDDYVWRMTDFYLRQQIEKAGYTYQKVPVYHTHHEIERIPYQSDEEKTYSKVTLNVKVTGPERIILDTERWKKAMVKHAMGIVKYLDPNYPLVKKYRGFNPLIAMLDRKWIAKNGPAWLKRYDKVTSSRTFLKGKIFSILYIIRNKIRAILEM